MTFQRRSAVRLLFLLLFSICIMLSINNCHHNQKKESIGASNFYFKDAAPVFINKCVSCHSGNKTLIEFKDYESIYGRRAMIKYVIENKLMPPWNLSKSTGPWKNDPGLTSKEKEIILKWISQGLPYKNKNIKLVKAHKKETIADPDYIIKLDSPVEVPAEGNIPLKRLISIPNFSEDKFLKEIEFIVKPKVIHHILLFTLNKKFLPEIKEKPNQVWHGEEKLLDGWGIGEEFFYKNDPNIGEKIPENSVFITHIHYEPIGQKTVDTETKIKLKFHSKPPKRLLFRVMVSDKNLSIPPYKKNYVSEIYYKLKRNMFLLGMSPHMHLRGKSSSILVRDPKGNETEIFNLNPYYFNFQKGFYLQEALLISKGSTLICRNYFDNSRDNPVNPDPSKNVKRGDYAEDEMSECYFKFLIPNPDFNA